MLLKLTGMRLIVKICIPGQFGERWSMIARMRKRTSLQVAELKCYNEMLVCDRNAPFECRLDEPADEEWSE